MADIIGIGTLFVVLNIAVALAYGLASNLFGKTNLVYAHYGIYLVFPAIFSMKFGLTDTGIFFVLLVMLISVGGLIANVTQKSAEKSLKTARSSWLTQSAFGAIILVYAFLIYFSFLNGWRVFR